MQKKRNWFWGVFLLLAGGLILLSQFTSLVTMPVIQIIALVILAALFISSLVRLNYMGMTVCLALAYTIVQETLKLPAINAWVLLLAAVLLGIGLSMLFRRRPKPLPTPPVYPPAQAYPQNGGVHVQTDIAYNSDDDHPYAKASFGSASRYVHAKNLESGQFYCSFGLLEVYLDQALLSPNGAQLYVDCNFGSIKLYVPRDWQVKDQVRATLGGVSQGPVMPGYDPSRPTITLTGYVQLGGIEVVYV